MPHVPKNKLLPLNLTNESIGQRIKAIRKKNGLTQKELANKIGIERTVIANYECDRIRLYDEMVTRFALALNVSTDEILGLKKKHNKNEILSFRTMHRFAKIEKLAESEKRILFKTIDNFLKGAEKK